ncbi:hypothetical protein POSPLADRAFT_1047872 [Postia placenta MAD-698-R-SB12]|uniref:Uncharacterized protein n=1 Tax=Postia placenta MAD-698-R-SB12 TaxID=670580 RepID=A0A1X6MW49_9APHY|nr:hypothetical protein POSPLADRAFT_1047872 [Postia placenta MAD-698-R-SB12]OSX60433.1 hypothetical protein POSPLADRAFT_1047872 [Postia placenta MAD-698-R-SB12]
MYNAASLYSQPSTTQQATDEVIADSEPEREGRRQRDKQLKKRGKKTKQSKEEVIELTDSDVGSAAPATKGIRARIIIEVTATDNRGAEIPDDDDNASETTFPSLGALLQEQLPTRRDPTPGAAVNHDINTSGNEDENIGSKLKQFAYILPPRLSRNPSLALSSRSGSIASTSRPKHPYKKSTPQTAYPFSAEFSDADMTRLRTCVGCECAWTTRKTVAQKLKHIRTCAKKRALTNETITILIRKELDKAPPTTIREEPQIPETLLEDVMQDTGAKRKGKRKQVASTVQTLAETRGGILGRAREMLGNSQPRLSATSNDSIASSRRAHPAMPPPTQAFGESSLMRRQVSDGEPVQQIAFASTQVFAPSKLATSQTTTLNNSSPRALGSEAAKMPPPTQAFASSSIGTTTRFMEMTSPPNPSSGTLASSANAATQMPQLVNTDSPAVDSRLSDPSHDPLHSTTSNTLYCNDVGIAGGSAYDVYYDYENQARWSFDDAVMHFDPHLPAAGRYEVSKSATPGPSTQLEAREDLIGWLGVHEADQDGTVSNNEIQSLKTVRQKKAQSKKKRVGETGSAEPEVVSPAEITETEFDDMGPRLASARLALRDGEGSWLAA